MNDKPKNNPDSDVPVSSSVERSESPAVVPHTPGPWRAEGSHVVDTAGICIKLNGGWTPQCWDGDAEAEANARLIAAAPELLVALRAARRAFSNILTFNIVRNEQKREAISEIRKTLDAAIAKAEGR